MVHGEKFFVIKENQDIWESYLNNILNSWEDENRERLEKLTYTDEEKAINIKKMSGYSEKGKDDLTPYKYEYRKKKQSVQQYKPILLEFEKYINKSFNEISAKDMEAFLNITSKTNKINHFNAFFRDCVSSGLIKNKDKDFLMILLPEIYRAIGGMLLKDGKRYAKDDENLSEKKGMIKCPFCGEQKEALAENWILIQVKGKQEKHLACNDCEGKDGKYRY